MSSARWQWKWTVRLRSSTSTSGSRLEVDVRRRRLLAVGLRLAVGVPLALVVAGLDELLALQGGDLHARERGLALARPYALGVLAVGHLEAAEDACRSAMRIASIGPAAELDVEGLPADDVAAAGHDVGGGDAAGQGHADAGVVGLDGVEGAQAGLHRAGHLVAVARGPARPAGKMPMCECVSTRPGMIVLPVSRGPWRLPGMVVSPPAPTATIFPLWTTSTPRR